MCTEDPWRWVRPLSIFFAEAEYNSGSGTLVRFGPEVDYAFYSVRRRSAQSCRIQLALSECNIPSVIPSHPTLLIS
jgi:hypothetical protein